MKRLWKSCLLVVLAMVLMDLFPRATVSLGAPQSTLPERSPITTTDLKEQIADCAISARSESAYEGKLIARIAELEKQLAALKAAAANSGPGKE